MRIRALSLVGIMMLVTAAAGSGVSAGSIAPFDITVNPSSVEVGQPYAVSASGTGLDCEQPQLQPEVVQTLEQELTLTIRQIVPSVGATEVLGTIPASGLPDGVAGPATFTAPLTSGTYEITGTYFINCIEREVTASATLIVTAPPASSSTTTTTTTTLEATTTTIAEQVAPSTTATTTTLAGTLPATGRSTDGLVWLALATLLLGGGFVTIAARRS